MSGEGRGVRFARSWVALYTRNLPEVIRDRRRAEIESDLWEQLNNGPSGSASGGVLDRCLRGIPADVWWRYRTLLEEREVRQGEEAMTRDMLTNWWGVITAIVGVGLLTLGVGGLIFGDRGGVGFVWESTTAGAGALILGGLALLSQRRVAGSRMILLGAAISVLSLFQIPIAVLIVAGGLWTGHLQIREGADPGRHAVGTPPAEATSRWYVWLVVAPVLFVAGLVALAILGDGRTATGEDDTGLVAGLAYLAWILSWLGALVATGIGIAFGIKTGLARHRTRPA